MNFSIAEENYIKAIWRLQKDQRNVTTNELSDELQTKPASVTDMLKRLTEKKLLNYQPYYGVKLTADGKKLALSIIRRHRLWEFFLVNKLQFNWDEVHVIAEELEHVGSQELIDRLDQFLGYPKVDPHGDPIPDKTGKVLQLKQTRLSEWPLNETATVSGVDNQSAEMLELLRHNKISIGSKLELKRKFDFDGSVEIKMGRQTAFTISKQVAQNLFVSNE
ncbi:MAG: metal-dependent transcriptional regulator [Chitinophagaceae bacterium]